LQGGHAIEEQIAFISNPARRFHNNRKRIRPTSAKEPCVARGCFDHIPFPVKVLGICVGCSSSNVVSFDYLLRAATCAIADLQLSLRSVSVDSTNGKNAFQHNLPFFEQRIPPTILI
jgi:hypothetical protein